MSELVSMKLSEKETKAMAEPSLVGGEKDAPRYPWGLSLNLDDDTLDKLKLSPLPKVGEKRLLIAQVEVTSVSSNQGPGKEKRESVALQITECCLEPATQRQAVEDALYPDGAKE